MVNPVVVLDSGPLGLVTNPKMSGSSLACAQWLQVWSQPEDGSSCRRSLIMRSAASCSGLARLKGVGQLDALAALIEYLPLTTPAMRKAAEFWAQARQHGQPTAGDRTIDADMILAGQAATLGVGDVVVATTNVGHLSRFVPAEQWHRITV